MNPAEGAHSHISTHSPQASLSHLHLKPNTSWGQFPNTAIVTLTALRVVGIETADSWREVVRLLSGPGQPVSRTGRLKDRGEIQGWT